VFVTHDITEAIALGDRTLVLSRAPAQIAGEHVINISRPRDIRGIMTHPEFAGLYQRIRAQVQ
jgi:NitT/TauT family transport system ATP-binding protein